MIAPSTDQVVAVIAGAPTIGAACEALRASGWPSSIAGNRITVSDRVFVRYVDGGTGGTADCGPRWIVYGSGERPAIRISLSGSGE